jgi:ATP-dependent Lon protease
LVALLEQVLLVLEAQKIESDINRRVQTQMENGQRQAILQEKLRAIQKEMGEDDEEETSTVSMRKKIEKSNMPKEAKEKAMSELKRMHAMSPMSQESGLLKTYLDELLSMHGIKVILSQ